MSDADHAELPFAAMQEQPTWHEILMEAGGFVTPDGELNVHVSEWTYKGVPMPAEFVEVLRNAPAVAVEGAIFETLELRRRGRHVAMDETLRDLHRRRDDDYRSDE